MRLRLSSTYSALASGSPADQAVASYWTRIAGTNAVTRYGVAAALSVTFAVLYLYTGTRDYDFDAVSYAHQVQLYDSTGNRMALFHPHHLLFNFTVWLLWRFVKIFGCRDEPLAIATVMNGLLGGLGIGMMWLVLRAILTRSRLLALLFSVGLGVSFGYWVCATDGRVNMPSLVLQIAAFLSLVATMQSPSRERAVATGVLTGLASLYHESALLFVGVAWVGILMAEYTQGERALERKARAATLGWYMLAFALTFLVPYLIVGIGLLHLTSFAQYRAWATRYAELGWWWDWRVWHNLRIDAYAMRRALFVEPGSKTGTFHIATEGSNGAKALYYSILVIWGYAVYRIATVFGLLIQTHYRRYLFVAITWVILNTAFFTIWNPEYFVFRVSSVIASAVIIAIAATQYRSRQSGPYWLAGIAIWIALYGVSNFTQSILPHEDARGNAFLQQSWWVMHHSTSRDLFVTTGMGDTEPIEVYLPYFTGRRVYAIHTELGHHDNSLALVSADMNEKFRETRAAGGTVYAFDDIWHDRDAQGALWIKHGVSLVELFKLFSNQNRTLAFKHDSEGRPVWKLTPRAGSPGVENPGLAVNAKPLRGTLEGHAPHRRMAQRGMPAQHAG